MRGKKRPPAPIAKIRKSGIVERQMSPATRAGRYWRGAYHLIPKFTLWIKFSCLVALLGALACLVIVFTRPRPILLVSFPDGTTVCSLPPLDPKTGRIIPRPTYEAELCAMLAKRAGRGADSENAEFSKESQVEPPSEARADLAPGTLIDQAPPVQPSAPVDPLPQPSPAMEYPPAGTPIADPAAQPVVAPQGGA